MHNRNYTRHNGVLSFTGFGGAVRALPECVVGVQVVREAIWALPGDHPCRWCSVRVLCRVFRVWRAGL